MQLVELAVYNQLVPRQGGRADRHSTGEAAHGGQKAAKQEVTAAFLALNLIQATQGQ